ncbi:MAG: hypothetical protein Q9163_006512, partial [Psora crenata]
MESTNPYFVAAAAGIILSTTALLVLSQRQQKVIMDPMLTSLTELLTWWLALLHPGRRWSTSRTLPGSQTPEKQVPGNDAPPTASYRDAFPPSVRENLRAVAASMPEARQKVLKGLPTDEDRFRRNVIPFTADYRDCASSVYTPMKISLEEVKALGDFPDYATLSGVPLPAPYNGFDIGSAITRPYRPFRWPYTQNMSLAKLEPDWWLEIEKHYVQRVKERERLYEQHGKLVLQYLPGSELGCKEIMEHALQFLCARYPQHFALEPTQAKGHVFKNALLENETVIRDMHPLHVLLHNVPEDFAVMLRNPEDGYYYFRAGVLCSSLGWNVDTKIGMQLKEIHQPIPDYKERMEFPMDR